MQIWGAVWGAALAALLSMVLGDSDTFWWAFWGALLGALAGWSLRRVLHSEWQSWHRQQRAEDLSVRVATATAQAAALSTGSGSQTAVASPEQTVQSVPIASAERGAAQAPTPSLAPSPKRRLLASSAQQQEALLADVQNLGTAPVEATQNPSHSLSGQAPTFAHVAGGAAQPAWLQAAQNWLAGGNVVVRLGVFLLFIGLAFLAKYAVCGQD